MSSRSGLLRYLTPTAATAIVVLFLLTSAVPLMYWLTASGLDVRLAEGQAVWDDLGIARYRFTLEARCACEYDSGGPVRVSIVNGKFAEAMALGGQPDVDIASPRRLRTIADLFDLIASEMARTYRVDAEFDADFGFPTRIEIDPSADQLDDDVLITVTGFDAGSMLSGQP